MFAASSKTSGNTWIAAAARDFVFSIRGAGRKAARPPDRSVPHVPQRRIGDYARVLADALERRHGLRTTFVSGTPAGVHPEPDDRWETCYVERRSGRAFARILGETIAQLHVTAVIVHHSPYGYQRYGAPWWLLHGLSKLRNSSLLPVLGVFHELSASGPLLSKARWVGLAQREISRRIWNHIDLGVTTNRLYFQQLMSWRASAQERLALTPVMSNVGEPALLPPVGTRPNHLVSFAGEGIEEVARKCGEELAQLLAVHRIEKIHDVGSRASPPPDYLLGVPIVAHGRLPAPELSRLLLDCRIGVLPYANMGIMGKSTILAAYASHGVAPYAFAPHGREADGLVEGCNYLTSKVVWTALAPVQNAILEWYAPHSSLAHAELIGKMLKLEERRS